MAKRTIVCRHPFPLFDRSRAASANIIITAHCATTYCLVALRCHPLQPAKICNSRGRPLAGGGGDVCMYSYSPSLLIHFAVQCTSAKNCASPFPPSSSAGRWSWWRSWWGWGLFRIKRRRVKFFPPLAPSSSSSPSWGNEFSPILLCSSSPDQIRPQLPFQ